LKNIYNKRNSFTFKKVYKTTSSLWENLLGEEFKKSSQTLKYSGTSCNKGFLKNIFQLLQTPFSADSFLFISSSSFLFLADSIFTSTELTLGRNYP